MGVGLRTGDKEAWGRGQRERVKGENYTIGEM